MNGVVGICLSKEKIMDDLSKQLEIYKENYARYRVSGDVNAKAVADTALGEAEKIIKNQQAVYGEGTQYIQGFVRSFTQTNPELVNLHDRSVVLEKTVPEVQTEFSQTQRMNETAVSILTTIDYTPYLIKAGVVLGLLAVTALAATF
jgi:hypothetical protein